MEKITTLGELTAMVRRDDLGKWDEDVEVSKFHSNKYGEIEINGKVVHLSPHAEAQLYNRIGIPAAYARRCPPDLLAPHINHWLEERSNQTWLVRGKNEEIRAILSTNYAILDNAHIITLLNQYLEGQGFEVVMCSVGDDVGFHARVVLPDVEVDMGAIRSGERDGIFGGIHISNSEIGKRSASVELMLWRLVCTNGMVGLRSQERFRQIHKGTNLYGSFLDGAEKILQHAKSDLEYELHNFETSMQEQTQYGEEIVKAYAHENRLTQAVTEEALVQLHYQSRSKTVGLFSRYDIINAFTAAARIEKGDKRYEVEAVAGELLNDRILRMETKAMRHAMDSKNGGDLNEN